jgi:hypothetical protein
VNDSRHPDDEPSDAQPPDAQPSDDQPSDDQQRAVADILKEEGSLTMPADVAQRVHEALAYESAVRAGAVSDLTHRRAPRWQVAASVAAAAVLGSTVLVTLLDQGELDVTTAAETEVESVQRDETSAADAATEGSAEQGSVATPGGAEFGAKSALPQVPAALLELVDDPAAAPGAPGCGSRLADDLDAQVVTAITDDAGRVLVLVQGPSGQVAWQLPSCESMSADALARSDIG